MTSIQTSGFADLSTRLEQDVRNHKGKYIFQGIVFVIGGILAAALPSITALNVGLLAGAILLATGIAQLVFTAKSGRHRGSLLSSLLSIIVGILMLWQPLGVLIAIVTLLALFMTLEGLIEIFIALEWRPFRSWGWMLFSGIVTLILAALLWIGYPTLGIVYVGWLIAINLLLYGISLLMLAWRFPSRTQSFSQS